MEAFVRCHYKAFLKCTGETGSITEYELLDNRLADEFRLKAIQHLAKGYTPCEVAPGPLSLEDVLKSRHRLILNVSTTDERLSITIPAIECLTSSRQQDYAVLTFSPGNRVTKPTKLFAALLGMALRTGSGLPVSCAKVVFGPRFSTTRIALFGPKGPTHLGNEATSMLRDLEAMVTTPVAPKMFLNSHCNVCEFRDRCRKDALERENLSLLVGLQPKEIDAWNERGIFTVTQLAHTFRPKTMGRISLQPKRHSQQLQAMAIRDKTTYVRKRPEMPAAATRVYFDVEGIPDTGLFYLIGVIVVKGDEQARHQFWADTESDQEAMWRNFLTVLTDLNDYVVIHFGRYEKDFVREMFKRYGGNSEVPEEGLLSRLFDVHAAIRTNVFFPVFGNSLKEIGSFLGFQWQGSVRSGIESIVWRYKWEEKRDATVKEELLRYNHEDCLAVLQVFNYLDALSHPIPGIDMGFQETGGMPNKRKGLFGPMTYALPCIEIIIRCGYFNYQHDKVFFRLDKNVKRSVARRQQTAHKRPKVNVVVHCSRPDKCSKCGSGSFTVHGGPLTARKIEDVKFFEGGIKRWVVRYETERYECRSCRRSFTSPDYPHNRNKSGRGVAVWAVFQHVALSQSFDAIARSFNDVFGYYFGDGLPQHGHRELARFYEATEQILLSKLRTGNMICGDEAKIGIRRSGKGYVWTFSGPEVVIYRFSPTRDATVLNDVLKGFTGVLVSDFYNVYDSAPCFQQKCIVHLIRDINDDLLKSPFDGELKKLANGFTVLMTSIVESIDRYGLKKRHLGKHVADSERYRKWLAGQQFTSTTAQGYQKRFAKYGDRLFTFLSHDGVPWNNNLAENAVKLITSRRKFLDGVMSANGLKDYLIFLSIYQTLRRKGASFLRFLLSGKTDIFEFLGE
jgi:predicted RecB family nuclease